MLPIHSQLLSRAFATCQCIESNSRKGNVCDNAVKESSFSLLEMELLRKKPFSTKAETMQAVFIYIEIFYNRQASITRWVPVFVNRKGQRKTFEKDNT